MAQREADRLERDKVPANSDAGRRASENLRKRKAKDDVQKETPAQAAPDAATAPAAKWHGTQKDMDRFRAAASQLTMEVVAQHHASTGKPDRQARRTLDSMARKEMLRDGITAFAIQAADGRIPPYMRTITTPEHIKALLQSGIGRLSEKQEATLAAAGLEDRAIRRRARDLIVSWSRDLDLDAQASFEAPKSLRAAASPRRFAVIFRTRGAA
jgi:hypothetical protein